VTHPTTSGWRLGAGITLAAPRPYFAVALDRRARQLTRRRLPCRSDAERIGPTKDAFEGLPHCEKPKCSSLLDKSNLIAIRVLNVHFPIAPSLVRRTVKTVSFLDFGKPEKVALELLRSGNKPV
jgi:hypothetical protein